jgi:L,D-transpeptidase ErfK/SrfK
MSTATTPKTFTPLWKTIPTMGTPINRQRRLLRLLPTSLLALSLAACAADGTQAPPTGQATPAPDATAQQPAAQAKTAEPAPAAVDAAPVAPEAPTEAAPQATTAPEMDRLVTTYTVKKGDDLLEIARAHDLGFLELRAANPGVDPWLPKEGSTLIMPTVHLLAQTLDNGIMMNLAEMRLYQFSKGQVVATHPLGIGREGLETPTGTTSVIRMAKNPSWYPTPRMRREKPELPAVVGPGPDNPFGNRAIYLGWDLYRIHGTNIPWGVGRRVSSGCLRMYPEDIEKFYEKVTVGTKVTVVNKRLVAEWRDNRLWVEVYPTNDGWDALEAGDPAPDMPLTTEMVAEVTRAVPPGVTVDWTKVTRAARELRGYPVAVSD